MKRAKIMLSALAVIVVVGGTLAFKASKFTQNIFYGCARSVVNGQVVTGCFYPVPIFAKTTYIVFGTIIPYNDVTTLWICTPPRPGVIGTCGFANVTASLSE